jgi:hypothetical protein
MRIEVLSRGQTKITGRLCVAAAVVDLNAMV